MAPTRSDMNARLLPFALLLALGCQSAAPEAEVPVPTPAAEVEEPAPVDTAPPAEEAPEPAATEVEFADPMPPSAEEAAELASDLTPAITDGIYTVDQARRGAGVMAELCADCHGVEDWSGDAFRRRWNEESVYRMFAYIHENMPEAAPPFSLPREQVTDVLTYIFYLNGVPAGDTELGSDDDSLDDHWIVWVSADER